MNKKNNLSKVTKKDLLPFLPIVILPSILGLFLFIYYSQKREIAQIFSPPPIVLEFKKNPKIWGTYILNSVSLMGSKSSISGQHSWTLAKKKDQLILFYPEKKINEETKEIDIKIHSQSLLYNQAGDYLSLENPNIPHLFESLSEELGELGPSLAIQKEGEEEKNLGNNFFCREVANQILCYL